MQRSAPRTRELASLERKGEAMAEDRLQETVPVRFLVGPIRSLPTPFSVFGWLMSRESPSRFLEVLSPTEPRNNRNAPEEDEEDRGGKEESGEL